MQVTEVAGEVWKGLMLMTKVMLRLQLVTWCCCCGRCEIMIVVEAPVVVLVRLPAMFSNSSSPKRETTATSVKSAR